MIGIFKSNLFTYLGLAIIIYKLFTLLLTKIIRSTRIEKFKQGWIVITGATSGIGKEFATQLSNKGFKLVLISRNMEKLRNTKNELSDINDPNNIAIICADFSQGYKDPDNFYKDLAKQLEKYDISGLINNVGVMPDFCNFPLNSKKEIENTIGVNIYPLTYITYFLIPKMISRYAHTGLRSIIINMSSVSAIKPSTGFNIYGSTKSYILQFSQCISYEYDQAINIMAVAPTAIRTRLSDKYRLSTTFASAPISTEMFVNNVWDQLHKRVSGGYCINDIGRTVYDILPDWGVMKITLKLLSKENPKLVDYRIYDEVEDKADSY